MFCPKCGKENDYSAQFCGSCGNKLNMVPEAEQSPAVSTMATGGVTAGDGSTAAAVRKTGRILAIICVVVVLAAAIAAFVTGGFGLIGPKYEVKVSADAYSWEELSKISEEISKAGSEDAAAGVAKTYNLTTSEGKLDGTQVKFVTLSDGTQAVVQIAGFAHDDKTDGGKAGITFIFKDAIAEHVMNSEPTVVGGWEKSAMRAWLSYDVLGMLPEDLRTRIVAVDKLTNNVGPTTSASATATSDKLWLYSLTELAGNIMEYQDAGYENGAILDAVLNAEGREYKLFQDSNVDLDISNAILAKTFEGESCYWWERSPIPDKDLFAQFFTHASPDGNPNYDFSYYTWPDKTLGVVPGFCI